jgi:hypothetical protein
MRYKPKNVAALHLALGAGSNAGQCRPIDRGFRKDRWRTSEGDNLGRELAITTPLDRYPESVVMVSKVVAKRAAPKP